MRCKANATANGQLTCSPELSRSARPKTVPCSNSAAVQMNRAVEASIATIVHRTPTAVRAGGRAASAGQTARTNAPTAVQTECTVFIPCTGTGHEAIAIAIAPASTNPTRAAAPTASSPAATAT
jgi:hypothetical protein